MRLDLEYKDLEVLAKRLGDGSGFKKAIAPYFRNVGQSFHIYAIGEAPNKQGDLAKSLSVAFPTPLSFVEGADDRQAPHAKFVYLGTRRHPITPKNKGSFTKTVTRNGKSFQQRFYHSLAFVKGGEVDFSFRKSVMHPGTKPNPFLLKSWNLHSQELTKEFSQGIWNVINEELNV